MTQLVLLRGLVHAAEIEAYWDPDFGLPAADSAIAALESDGRHLFAGGTFVRIGETMAQGIATWNGELWTALGAGVSSDGSIAGVQAILPHDGRIYVGGIFTKAGDVDSNNVAMWDGARWHSLGEGFDSDVKALAWFDGHLHAAGSFSMSGDQAVSRVARWAGTEWVPLGEGVSRPREQPIPGIPVPIPGRDFETVETAVVNALAGNDRFLYVAGAFDSAGGVDANSIAAWDGVSWHSLGQGLQQIENGPASFRVADLAVHQEKLYAGGIFRYAGTVAADGLAAWDGTMWESVGNLPAGSIGSISKLVTYGGDLYVGGLFSQLRDDESEPSFNHVARWDGASWAGLGTAPGNRPLLGLAAFQGALWIGGSIVSGPMPGGNNPSVFHIPGRLTVRRQDADLHLSWPLPDTALRLETTDSLLPTTWEEASAEPQAQGHRWTVSETIRGTHRYFRLGSAPADDN